MSSSDIAAAIREHGAQAVYSAANKHMVDGEALARVGLAVKSMGDVWAIQSAAYAELGDAAKAIDHAQADATLDAIAPAEPKRRGRPAKAPEDRLMIRGIRLSPAHWAKIDEYGMEWLRKVIDKAKPPKGD